MKRKVSSLVLSLFILMCIMMFGSISAQADAPYLPESMTIIKTASDKLQNISLDGVKKNTIKKLKSSNKKVATVKTFQYGSSAFVSVHPIKPGKTTVSFSYKYKGKTYKAKVAVTVIKYTCPVSVLKIGSTSYTSKFKNEDFVILSKAVKGKLIVKPKSGWKLISMGTYDSVLGGGWKNQKNNSKLNLKKGYSILIDFENKKTKEHIGLTLRVEK